MRGHGDFDFLNDVDLDFGLGPGFLRSLHVLDRESRTMLPEHDLDLTETGFEWRLLDLDLTETGLDLTEFDFLDLDEDFLFLDDFFK